MLASPNTCMNFTSRSPTRFSQWRWEKNPLVLPTEVWRKQSFWNIPRAFYSSYKGLPSKETTLPEPQWLKQRKYPPPACFCLPVSPKGEENKTEKHWWTTQPRAQLTNTLTPLRPPRTATVLNKVFLTILTSVRFKKKTKNRNDTEVN